MKELSIKKKAERYDELLVKLQEAKVDNEICDERYCCVIDDIVPELKESESEDEKIRKSLLEYLHTLPNHYSHSGVCAPEWIAWVEKQGEQKPVVPKFRVGDFVKDTNYHGEPIYEIVGMDNECYICQYRGNKSMGDRGVMHFAFDNPYLRLVEQKPAEWSEEDEALREKVINTIWAYANMPHCGINFEAANELECWLKSIRPLPKQEWSEEDEKIRKELLVHCQKLSEASNAIKQADEYAKYNSWVAWLKSLRPQKQRKPSDAQMNALETAVSSLQSSALESLYNKLKKLREE